MIGYEYGNTRLRVRGAQLFDADDYLNLLRATTLDGLLGALSSGPYRPDVESALGRHRGLRRLDEAVRMHLSTQLTDVLAFYGGEIGDRLRLYESRWDNRNLRTILRSLVRPERGDSDRAFLVAAGSLDDVALGEVANQKDVRGAVDLLSVWHLPSPTVVRHLRGAMPEFSETGDIAALERALDESFGETVIDAVAAYGSQDPLIVLLCRDVDRANLTAALRWREDSLEMQRVEPFVPVAGGRLRDAAWAQIATLDDRADVEATLTGFLPVEWRGSVAAWAEHGNLARLEHELDAADIEIAAHRFRTGDPLGIDIPLGFILRAEAQAKNLRLVGRTIVHDLPRDAAFDQLLGLR